MKVRSWVDLLTKSRVRLLLEVDRDGLKKKKRKCNGDCEFMEHHMISAWMAGMGKGLIDK